MNDIEKMISDRQLKTLEGLDDIKAIMIDIYRELHSFNLQAEKMLAAQSDDVGASLADKEWAAS